eukprot:g3669.t1
MKTCVKLVMSCMTSLCANTPNASPLENAYHGGKDGIIINANFDSGNILVEKVEVSFNMCDNKVNDIVSLRLRKEPFTEGTDKRCHAQWFYFRSSQVKDRLVWYRIVNAGESSYPTGWKNYKTCASYDGETWFRIEHTWYDETNGSLEWKHYNCTQDTVWFAYFAPYTYERHQKLIAQSAMSPLCSLRVLGLTLDLRPIDYLKCGTGPKNIWVNARVHPGESMAEWFMEGFIGALLDEKNEAGQCLRQQATIHMVPNMNPDGTVRGHLRTNAAGANLNREWCSTGTYKAPSLERSPEVFHVLNEIILVGCDAYVDVHGDEEIEANFFADYAGCPNWSPRLKNLFDQFSDAYCEVSKDFQRGKGYGSDAPGKANLAIGADQITNRFDCLAVTLEMPFKDATFNNPEPERQWTPERSKALGASLIGAFLKILPNLKPSK